MKAMIIGAGVAGLGTAIRLAKKGYTVEVFEANDYPGGKLTSLQLGGYRFDAGPSLFTMPHYVDELLALSPEPIDFSYTRKQVVCNYFFDDQTRFCAFADQERYLQEAEQVLAAKPEQLTRYFENAREKYELTAPLFLEKSLHKASTYLSADTLKALIRLRRLHINDNLDTVNRQMLDGNEKLIQLFNRYATYNGSSPYQTPGIMSMIPHLEQHIGTFFPKGGMVSITNALVRTAESLGVSFHFSTPVDEIIVSNKRAVGIRLDDRILWADLVVSNMDVVPTYRRLLPNQKAPEKTLQQERSSSAIIFYWGIKRSFPELDLHNIFFSADYEQEFREIFQDRMAPKDPTVYVHISAKNEPADAPEGCENWFVMVNVPADNGQDWGAQRHRVRAAIINRLNKALNISVEHLIEEEDYLDPRRIQARTSSYQGALYGAASNNKFAAFLRHPNFSQRIKNLYFCGGSAHPGGGIPLCLLSAKIVCELIPHAN